MSEELERQREYWTMQGEADRELQERLATENRELFKKSQQQHEQQVVTQHREFMERLGRLAAAIERLADRPQSE